MPQKEMPIPRRCQVDKMIPAEIAIKNAAAAVEEAGADPLLTEAICLLADAQEKVAAWYDAQN